MKLTITQTATLENFEGIEFESFDNYNGSVLGLFHDYAEKSGRDAQEIYEAAYSDNEIFFRGERLENFQNAMIESGIKTPDEWDQENIAALKIALIDINFHSLVVEEFGE